MAGIPLANLEYFNIFYVYILGCQSVGNIRDHPRFIFDYNRDFKMRPDKTARIEILRIHLLKEGSDPEQFDLAHMAEIIAGWSAAEIEQMVKSARIDAFTDGRELIYDDIIHNIYRIVPLSKTMSEQLAALRIWSHNRATSAN